MLLHSQIINPEAKKTLLILHGFLGSLDNWKTLAQRYANVGFQVHSLDLRNHGKSFHSDAFSYPIMAHDVLEYCAANQLTEINLISFMVRLVR